MKRAGTLSPKYSAAMAGAAYAHESLRRCQREIETHGATYKHGDLIKINPAVRESRDWLALQLRYLCELGLTPVSNRRVEQEEKRPTVRRFDPIPVLRIAE